MQERPTFTYITSCKLLAPELCAIRVHDRVVVALCRNRAEVDFTSAPKRRPSRRHDERVGRAPTRQRNSLDARIESTVAGQQTSDAEKLRFDDNLAR
jgi:hypothetical protein